MKKWITLLIGLGLSSCSHTPKDTPMLSATQANLRGHQELYQEGWGIISSTEKAFQYAEQHSIQSSGAAFSKWQQSIAAQNSETKQVFQENQQASLKTGEVIRQKGAETKQKILDQTEEWAAQEWEYSQDAFAEAADTFVQGYLYYQERTQEDLEALQKISQEWSEKVSRDFESIDETAKALDHEGSIQIENEWDDAFAKASQSFKEGYEASGEDNNSLSALGSLFGGYLNALYDGLIQPSAKSLVSVGEASGDLATAGAKKATQWVFLPTAKSTVIAGRTIQATGKSLYYTSKLGVALVSPSVKAGFLGALGMVSAGSSPLTYATGQTMGVVNQVAFVTGSAAATGGQMVGSGVVESGKYVALVTYDTLKAGTDITIHQAKSGVVLGYNAMTAIPAHLLMGAFNSMVLLAYDGPRLVLVSVQSQDLPSVPVGSIVDLDKLREQPDTEVQVLSEDPQILQSIIQELPHDLQ